MRNLCCIVLLAAAAFAGEPPGSYYANEAWGFKVKAPKDWRETAVSADTPWLCSKHLGKRELEGRTENRDWMTMETPEMWVVAFPHRAEGGAGNPHQSYRDYITGDDKFIDFGDGYRFVEEGSTTVDGAKVTTFEIRKGEKKRIGRRVVAWVFHFDDVDFAVQFKVLEWSYDDYKSSFRGCLKSFRRIERKQAIGGSGDSDEKTVNTRTELDQFAPAERADIFKDSVEAAFKRATGGLPGDWKHSETKKFLVLTNADSKFVRAASQHANAVLAHFDKMFGKPSEDYIAPFILRIFATEEQWRAYGKSNESSDAVVRDIAIYSGKGYVKDNSFEELNQALWSRWLQDRHPLLEGMVPPWLKEGLKKYMRMMRSKGKKITFAHDDWDRDEIRLRIKKKLYEPLLTIMSRGIHDRGESHPTLESHDRDLQIRTVCLWLMRQGNKGKQKNLVPNLIGRLAFEIEAFEAEWIKANPRKEKEEQLAEWVSRRRADAGAKRIELLKKAWDHVFAKWRDKDWDKFTKSWLSFAK